MTELRERLLRTLDVRLLRDRGAVVRELFESWPGGGATFVICDPRHPDDAATWVRNLRIWPLWEGGERDCDPRAVEVTDPTRLADAYWRPYRLPGQGYDGTVRRSEFDPDWNRIIGWCEASLWPDDRPVVWVTTDWSSVAPETLLRPGSMWSLAELLRTEDAIESVAYTYSRISDDDPPDQFLRGYATALADHYVDWTPSGDLDTALYALATVLLETALDRGVLS